MKRLTVRTDDLLNDFQEFQLEDYVSNLSKPQSKEIVQSDYTKDCVLWQNNLGLVKFMSSLRNFRKNSHKYTQTATTEMSAVSESLQINDATTKSPVQNVYREDRKSKKKIPKSKQNLQCHRKISHIQLSFSEMPRYSKTRTPKSKLRTHTTQSSIRSSIQQMYQNIPSPMIMNIYSTSKQPKISELPKCKQSRIRASIYRFLMRSRGQSVGPDHQKSKNTRTQQSDSPTDKKSTLRLDPTFIAKQSKQTRGFLPYKSRLVQTYVTIHQK